MTYSLMNYFDVWGNKKDGYTVNNQCIEFDDLYIDDTATGKDIARYLKSIGFLATDDLRVLRVDTDGELIEIYERRSGCPVCALFPNY